MSVRIQSFALGVITSAVLYGYTFKGITAYYQDAANTVSRMHYDIHPSINFTAPTPQTRRNWITGSEEPAEYSGKTVTQSWNNSIRSLYVRVAERFI